MSVKVEKLEGNYALLTIAILSLFWPTLRERIEQKRSVRTR